ncbi:hypothetical protein [Neisseria gonorrhoeae]|uniref:hypothetical protein n=1 Tax=Neisseria gonorrhoeae TaxID=485 RepID=UPI0011C07F41|nr:hypothetical protein [Neisseria gonorrhoeae]UWT37439.1 hypothetical protein NDQ65_10730 [Neisseria gonorrhoeae]
MNPAPKKPSLLFSSLLFSSLLFSSLPQRRRQVKAMAAARMCRRIWLTPTSTSPAIIPMQPVQTKAKK